MRFYLSPPPDCERDRTLVGRSTAREGSCVWFRAGQGGIGTRTRLAVKKRSQDAGRSSLSGRASCGAAAACIPTRHRPNSGIEGQVSVSSLSLTWPIRCSARLHMAALGSQVAGSLQRGQHSKDGASEDRPRPRTLVGTAAAHAVPAPPPQPHPQHRAHPAVSCQLHCLAARGFNQAQG